MLGKKESCDSGTIESPKATVVTYVEQDPEFPAGSTVKDAVYGADNPLMRCVDNYGTAVQLLLYTRGGANAYTLALQTLVERFP